MLYLPTFPLFSTASISFSKQRRNLHVQRPTHTKRDRLGVPSLPLCRVRVPVAPLGRVVFVDEIKVEAADEGGEEDGGFLLGKVDYEKAIVSSIGHDSTLQTLPKAKNSLPRHNLGPPLKT